MAPCYHHHPHHIYDCHFNRNEATRLETWWQFIFEPSGDLNRVIFMIYYEKTFKIWILKNLVRIFSYFQAIFMNPWSRGKHSWLWIGRSGFESRRDQLFFSIIFSIFAFLSICGKRWDNANFKMGSAVTVSNQKVEIYYFNELWRKKKFDGSRIWTGDLMNQSQRLYALSYSISLKKCNFTLGVNHLESRWWEPLWHEITWKISSMI